MRPSRLKSDTSITYTCSTQKEPELTRSIKAKLCMLPDLRREEMLGQWISKQTSQQDIQSETSTQISSHSYASPHAMTDINHVLKPSNKTRYTISNRIEPQLGTFCLEEARIRLKMSTNGTSELSQFHNVRNADATTNLGAHTGQTAVIRPPSINDDLESRLEGLRQFKVWSARIHTCQRLQEEKNLPFSVRSDCEKVPLDDLHLIQCVEQAISEQMPGGQLSLPCGRSEIVQTILNAPTPFCSPQVTPVPVTNSRSDQTSNLVSPSWLDLHSVLPQESDNGVTPPRQSRTVVISSGSRTLSIPVSSVANKGQNPEQTVEQYSTAQKSRPPVSFPKDFYERFPDAEVHAIPMRQPNLQSGSVSGKITPGISPKTRPTLAPENNDLTQDLEPLSTPCDKSGRPNFYTTIHHFTDCAHASPPANRPIDNNTQPRPDPDSHPHNPENRRSVIPGACFNCDTTLRRNQEDVIANTTTSQIVQLAGELSKLLDQLELADRDEQVAINHEENCLTRLLSKSTFAKNSLNTCLEIESGEKLLPTSNDIESPQSTDRQKTKQRSFSDRVVHRIHFLEAQIDQLRLTHDEQIRKVWLGYTSRWGPATLGVQRCGQSINTNHFNFPQTVNDDMRKRVDQSLEEIDAIQVTGTESHTPGSAINHNGRFQSRARSKGIRSRSCTAISRDSVESDRDVPGSRQPGEGKMMVGWIRE